MRMIICLIAASVAVTGLSATPSDARDRTARAKPKAAKVVHQRTVQRSSTVGANGLCQRDTGTPESGLNFRNKCDVEEFWARIMERSSDVGP